MIDSKDLVFAIHVASFSEMKTKPIGAAVRRKKPAVLALERYRLTLSEASDASLKGAGACARQLAYRLQSRERNEKGWSGTIELDGKAGEKIIDMPVLRDWAAPCLPRCV